MQLSSIEELVPLLTRVVAARVRDPHDREDVVQEALARTLAARYRVTEEALAPYAVAVARNLTAALHARGAHDRRHRHRLLDPQVPIGPEEAVLRAEEDLAVRRTVTGLPASEREVLVGHVDVGHATAALAAATGGTAGGVAARLGRARARARVDYVLALRRQDLPSARCRPVLLAISAADRRRQQALDAGGHLLSCPVCPELVDPLRRRQAALAGVVPLPVLLLLPRARDAVGRWPAQAALGAGLAAAVTVAVAAAVDSPPQVEPLAVAVAAPISASPSPAPVSRPSDAVRVTGVVDDVAAPYSFWLRVDGAAQPARVYVHFHGLPERQVRLGDRVTVRGALRAVTPEFLADRDSVDPRKAGPIRAAGRYLQAEGPNLDLS